MSKAEAGRQKAEAPLPPQAAALAAQSPIANRQSPILWAVLLVLVTLAVYWPATRCDFIDFDDPYYVSGNPHVQGGLTWENFKWAWVNPVADNWHPLTVWSHMLVCQVCGVQPWGHHLANVVLHALNAALVFVVLQRLTGAQWRSLLVAGLFALHPLRLESVVWVSERKDVLSGFFGLLALLAYVRYAKGKSEVRSPKSEGNPKPEGRNPKPEATSQQPVVRGPSTLRSSATKEGGALSHLPSSVFYLLSLFFYALGLMSKPTLVTWPFVMLLLDYWPLGRMQIAAASDPHHAPRTTVRPSPILFPLLLEKLPFFVLAALGSLVTFLVQQHGISLASGAGVPLGARVGNALISYCRQLGHEFWPTRLAVFYPHPGEWPLAAVLLAAGVVLAVSVAAWVRRRRQPYLLVGWLWFVGMLVPAIGLVQTGGQAMADRHTYLPSLGLLVLVTWGAGELVRGKAEGRRQNEAGTTMKAQPGARLHPSPHGARAQSPILPCVAASLAILGCLVLTRQQLGYWRDGETLFRHALEVTGDNYVARNCLGAALLSKGQAEEAITQYSQALRLKPNDVLAANNLGVALLRSGQTDQAIRQFQQALMLKPDYTEARKNLVVALAARTSPPPPPGAATNH